MTRPLALVVHAHPSPDSFNAHLARVACDALDRSHRVELIELYGQAFRPVMDADELHDYDRSVSMPPDVVRHAALVSEAETLVFVYPTWWMSLPAILKGWLERVVVPGVAFTLGPGGGITPALDSVRRIVGVTTYGSPRWRMLLVGDGGRRILHRALRMTVPHRVERIWLGLHDTDASTPGQREAFARRVHDRLSTL